MRLDLYASIYGKQKSKLSGSSSSMYRLLCYYLHARHSSGCLKGKARPLSIAASEISGCGTILQFSSCNLYTHIHSLISTHIQTVAFDIAGSVAGSMQSAKASLLMFSCLR